MVLHGSHVFVWIATAALGALPLMAITWRGLESEREAFAFRVLVRRLREFLNGRAHTYADGVLIEGHLGERQGSIQLLSIDGQNQLLVSLACGRSPSLHILPIAAKRSPGLEAYIAPQHSVGLMHSIWTDDATAVSALLSEEEHLRTIRQFCLNRNSSLRIGSGTVELHGPMPSDGDYFEHIRSVALKLSGIAAGFEREKVQLPRSHVRQIVIAAVTVICVVALAAVAAPSIQSMLTSRDQGVKVIHFEPPAFKGWRGVTPDDFSPEDLAWAVQGKQSPHPVNYVDFDGSKEETGTLQFLRRNNEEDAPFRLVCYYHGKQISDDQYANVAFVLRFDAKATKAANWIGTAPPKLPSKGEALLVVTSRRDIKSGVVYVFDDGKVGKYYPADFRFQ